VMVTKGVTLIVALTVVALLLLAPLMPKIVVFRVLVYKEGKLTPAMVYLFAAYPSGFKFLRGLRAETGFAEVTIDLSEMFREWSNIHDREITPTFLVTAITDSGEAVMKAFNMEWGRLTPGSVHKLVVEFRKRGERLASKAPCLLKMLGSEATCPQPGPASQAIIADAYGERKRVNLLKVVVDDRSFTDAFLGYVKGVRAGFSIAYAFLSTGEWDIAGWYYVSKTEEGKASTSPGYGKTAVISMEIEYLYQKWCYYDPQGNLVNEEVRVYADNFYPATIDAVTGEDLPVVDNWEYKGTYTAQAGIAYYNDDHISFGGEKFAVNLLWFLSLLSSMGRLPAWAVGAANYATLFLNVDYKYGTSYAFALHVAIFGDGGTVHDVYRAWHEFPGLDTPIVYYRTDLKG